MSRLTCENCKRWNTVDCPESYREPAGCDDICSSFEFEVDTCLLDKIKREIEAKSFTEEIFDEDAFRSAYTESVTKEEAEEESIIETEVVKLSDVLEIISKYSGKNPETDDKADCNG